MSNTALIILGLIGIVVAAVVAILFKIIVMISKMDEGEMDAFGAKLDRVRKKIFRRKEKATLPALPSPSPAASATGTPNTEKIRKGMGFWEISIFYLSILGIVIAGIYTITLTFGGEAPLRSLPLTEKFLRILYFGIGGGIIIAGLSLQTCLHTITDPNIGIYTSWRGESSSRILKSGVHFCFPYLCNIEEVVGGKRTLEVFADPASSELECIPRVKITIFVKVDTLESSSLRGLLEYPLSEYEEDLEEVVASSVGTLFGEKTTKAILSGQKELEEKLLACLLAGKVANPPGYSIEGCEIQLPPARNITSVAAAEMRIIDGAKNAGLEGRSKAERAGDIELMKAAGGSLAGAAAFFMLSKKGGSNTDKDKGGSGTSADNPSSSSGDQSAASTGSEEESMGQVLKRAVGAIRDFFALPPSRNNRSNHRDKRGGHKSKGN